MDLAAVAAAGDGEAPVGTDGAGDDDVVVALVGHPLLARRHVPDVAVEVLRAARSGEERLAVRAEAEGTDNGRLIGDVAQEPAGLAVPQPDRTIVTAGRNRPVGGRDCDREDLVAIAGHGRDLAAVAYRPQLRGLVEAARDHARAIGREGNAIDFRGVAPEHMQQPKTGNVPDDRRRVAAARDEPLAVGREGEGEYNVGVPLEQASSAGPRRNRRAAPRRSGPRIPCASSRRPRATCRRATGRWSRSCPRCRARPGREWCARSCRSGRPRRGRPCRRRRRRSACRRA